MFLNHFKMLGVMKLPFFSSNIKCALKNRRELLSALSSPFSTRKTYNILGIESSCDDTGCAVVNSDGILLAETLHSQHLVHLRNGGIIPPVAQDLHRQYIEPVVNETITKAGLSFSNIDAIAVTNKPGLPLSLGVGLKYAKYLARKYSKPLLPIHHMEAHALMARMETKIEFPFLVLLISGGHSLLAVAKDVDNFLLLGNSLSDSPGEAFDKVARRSKLRNIPIFAKLSGGQAIELAATMSEKPGSFLFPMNMMEYKDCNVSFSGIKSKAQKFIEQEEKKHEIKGNDIIPQIYDFCFDFQMAITKHLCQRTQRAIEYAELTGLIPSNKRILVVSGGVASNDFIAKGLNIVCKKFDYELVRPRPKLCTDNGIMIAWNGVERFVKNIGIVNDISSVDIEPKATFGINKIKELTEMNIKCKWVKLDELYNNCVENKKLYESIT